MQFVRAETVARLRLAFDEAQAPMRTAVVASAQATAIAVS
jgi:hypothetical protein